MSKSCNGCATSAKKTTISIDFELNEARHERREKRYIVALIVSIFLIFASNAIWLYSWMQYDYTSEEIIVEQDAKDGGNANYIGNNGDINNGLSESYKTQENTN